MKKYLIMLFSLGLILTGCGNVDLNAKQSLQKETAMINVSQSDSKRDTTFEEDSTKTMIPNKVKEESSIKSVENDDFEVLTEIAETPVDETVWVNTYSNIRSGPGKSYEIIGKSSYSDTLHRVAVLDNGWSRIEYNGEKAYINSKLIQTTEITVPIATTTEDTTTLCVGIAKDIFDATNAERTAAGLNPLVWSDELARAADVRAEEIISKFSHERPDGTKCYSLSSKVAGENIIRGPHATGQEMVTHWMASEGHKANILYADYGSIGISTRCTERGDTGCQLFGY